MLGIDVYGLSPDDIESHTDFAIKHGLNFPLLSDPDHLLLEALGVWGEKEWGGKKFMGATRTTLLVDEAGTIVQRWDDVQAQDHAAAVLAYCEQ